MEFAFTDEQEQLRREARTFLADRYPSDRVAELADSDDGWDAASWAQLAELGWIGVSVPEEAGGAGLGFLEEAVLFEELGRALYPGPYFSTVALALPELSAELQRDAVDGKTRWSASLDGSLVPDLASVDRVLVVRGGDLVAVQAEGQTLETMDSTRRLGRLADGGAGDTVGDASALDRMRTRAFAALALESVGLAQRALELTVEYAKTREQFGKPIGIYQAVSHRLADSYALTELARSLAYWSAWCVAEDDDEAPVAAAAAKAYAGDVAVTVCEYAIQAHGGIGFTWEHPLHRYYKRAQWNQGYGGYPAAQRAEIATAILS
ncbi:MAG TPA: acyl-CoA dehydrogenase family protein [Gaiellaceae bacterium]|nr:acyl-CoA dehydrogenase family protein [Gaiellaceae bacterium]